MSDVPSPEKGDPIGGGLLPDDPAAEARDATSDSKPDASANEATVTSGPAAVAETPALPTEPIDVLASGQPCVSEIDPDELAQWNEQVRRRMRRQTRRSFLVGGAAAVAGLAGWGWLQSRPERDGTPWPLRRALEANEKLARAYFSTNRLAPDFRGKAPLEDRVNGDLGLDDPVDPRSWRLNVEGSAGRRAPLELTLDAIQRLPRVEMTTEFKCIEGWSAIIQWAGVRFSDFMTAFPPATRSGDPFDLTRHPEDAPPYVGMETPDGGYYVGLDIESMLHPQTLLAYEMNGAPLTQDHGAPLRLVTPVKYGVKNIKRLGTIRYSRQRPADYWAEQGYDWYIGL